MAWVMARMWASVNVPCSGVPRWPLVPKLTSWLGSPRSGLRSKYSRSSRARSTSISFGAGLPASGEIATWVFLSFHSDQVPQGDQDWLRSARGQRGTREPVPLAGCDFYSMDLEPPTFFRVGTSTSAVFYHVRCAPRNRSYPGLRHDFDLAGKGQGNRRARGDCDLPPGIDGWRSGKKDACNILPGR